MELNGKTVLICDCEATIPLDGRALAKACRSDGTPAVNTHLCRAQLDNFRAALRRDAPLLVACTQEAPLFGEVAAEVGAEADLRFVNIRERAGWSTDGAAAIPKIAALLAEAALDLPPAPTVTMRSDGVCLVYGRDETAIAAAQQLAGRLDVTVLLMQPQEVVPPRTTDVPIFRGKITALRGHLGAFELTVDDYAPALPSSRRSLAFAAPRDGVASHCDLILDLTGGTPLVPAPDRRDGYFRPARGDPAAVQRTLFDMIDMVGEFEKPRYVDFHAELCAHSRSRKIGCTRCLDVCPAGAIAPDGDTVRIDPFLCGGCGACHSVCPTGAASYALPPPAGLINRLRTLLGTYYGAGGERAVLLAHDGRHGEEVIALLARYGGGLPANVIPFALNEVTQLGLDGLAGAFAYGAAQFVVLAPPAKRAEFGGLEGQIAIADAVLQGLGYGSGRIRLLVEDDPEIVERTLRDLPVQPPPQPGTHLALGDKRSLTRAALARLHRVAPTPADILPLPAGAPFGRVVVDIEGCTLCLACVGACPTGALRDNPDKPQLRFQEDACVQCGLCKATCPERVIALEPRLSFTDAAIAAQIVKEEEPFACIRCGKPFGSRSSIERVLRTLAGKHSMFRSERMIRTIQMCDDCRVIAQFEEGAQPLAGPAAGQRD